MNAQDVAEIMRANSEMIESVSRVKSVPLGTSTGITRREYFAARAPEAPDWFRYTPEEGRPPQVTLPDPEKELNTWEQEELRVWKDGEGLDFTKLSNNVRAFMLRYQKAHQANERFQHWRMKNREAKYWAWRFYYADQMIERSAK